MKDLCQYLHSDNISMMILVLPLTCDAKDGLRFLAFLHSRCDPRFSDVIQYFQMWSKITNCTKLLSLLLTAHQFKSERLTHCKDRGSNLSKVQFSTLGMECKSDQLSVVSSAIDIVANHPSPLMWIKRSKIWTIWLCINITHSFLMSYLANKNVTFWLQLTRKEGVQDSQ